MSDEDFLVRHVLDETETRPLISAREDLARPDTRSPPQATEEKGLPDSVGATTRSDAHVHPILRERYSPQLDITGMSQPELQNIMASMQAMAAAQLRRFDAAGVLVLVFDKGGTALQVFERPEHDAITDDYARAAVAQVVGIETQPPRKGKRR